MTKKILKGGLIADGSSVHDVLYEMAQNMAAQKAGLLTDITDNSTGTSGGGTVASLGSVAAYTTAGTDLAPKAGFDAELAKVKNGLKTFHTKLAEAATALGVDLGFTYSGGGTDGSGTIAAISSSLTEVDGSGNTGLAFAGTNTIITNYSNAIATLVVGLNRVRNAAGYSAIVDSTGGTFQTTVAALASTTGSGVAGTSLSGVEGTDAEGVLAAMKNAVATLAAGLNEVTGTAPALTVSVG